MAHRRSFSSADVRQRCHAVRHSLLRLWLTSCGACAPSSSARFGRASSSRLDGGSGATCLSLSCSGRDCRPRLANRTSLASTVPTSTPGSPDHLSTISVRDWVDVGGAWQAAPRPRAYAASTSGASTRCTCFPHVLWRHGPRRMPWLHQNLREQTLGKGTSDRTACWVSIESVAIVPAT